MKFRPTKTQKSVLSRMERGEHLRIQHDTPPYFFDGADPVNARTVKSLIAAGKIKPGGDGLLDGFDQTLVLA